MKVVFWLVMLIVLASLLVHDCQVYRDCARSRCEVGRPELDRLRNCICVQDARSPGGQR